MFLFLPREPTIPNGYRGYKGSFWWYLTRDCIEYIHGFVHSDAGKHLNRFFRFGYHSAEHFYQTLLLKSAYHDQIIKTDHRFVIWYEDSRHPKNLGGRILQPCVPAASCSAGSSTLSGMQKSLPCWKRLREDEGEGWGKVFSWAERRIPLSQP